MKAKKSFFLLVVTLCTLMAETDYGVENTNITISPENQDIYNYNRLRLSFSYEQNGFFSTFIGDGVNYYSKEYIASQEFTFLKQNHSDTPFETQSSFYTYDEGVAYTKIYRAYVGYEDLRNRVVAGVQNIPMGVGHIFNPVNVYNPQNIYAIEPDEVYGVAALSYTNFLSDTSQVNFILSQREDYSYEVALRYKAFVKYADIGLDVITSDKLKMFAYEIEGNLADTGIELRSEGAYITTTLKESTKTYTKEFSQVMLGGDYGFENGVALAVELLYSSATFSYEQMVLNFDSQSVQNFVDATFSVGLSFSYDINLFLGSSFIYVKNNKTDFFSPALSYTLNDFNSFTLGAMLDNSDDGSSLRSSQDVYYFKYLLSF